MKIEFKELNKDRYEALCGNIDVPLTQRYFYGGWQMVTGKKVWRYSIEDGSKTAGFFQVIKYQLPFAKNYLYVPHGPVFITEVSEEILIKFKDFCTELLKREGSIFLRFDPTWKHVSEGLQQIFFRSPKITYDGSFQPKYEWMLDLTQSEGDILAGMKKVNRYTVRQSEKAGVKLDIIEKNFLEYLDNFYELVRGTAKRDGFSHNTKEYYRNIFSECERNRNAFMVVAWFNGEIMLINFFVVYGDTAFFLFSGSEDANRRIGYTYLAQWGAIRHAKKIGLRYYNFGAVIPDDNKYPFYKNWQGFSDFKKRFGGTLVEYSDFHDIISNKFWYFLFVLSKLRAIMRRFFLG